MELVFLRNGDYERYEQAILERDALRKVAMGLKITYLKEFGELEYEVFQEQISCIRLKKQIAYCQSCVNHGEEISLDEMKIHVDREMTDFTKMLSEMLEQNKAAKACGVVDVETVAMVRKIYHRIVHLLHPDINPKTAESPELSELWERTVRAYRFNELKELQELEVLVSHALEQLGSGKIQVEIPDLEQKILAIEEEISAIRNSEPYLYREILDDPEKIAAKKETMRKEREEYRNYAAELSRRLEELLHENGIGFVWIGT